MIDDILHKQLSALKWKVAENNKSLSINNCDRKIDALIKINKQLFAADIKQSKNIENILATTFYRVYTRLSSVVNKTGYRPLAIFLVDNILKKSLIDNLQKQFQKYAPEFSWLLINKAGGRAYKLYNEKEINFSGLNIANDLIKKSAPAQLGFSDMELWMFKTLYFHNSKTKLNISLADNGQIKNAFQLSRISAVSRRTANNWVNSMTELGFLAVDDRGMLSIINLEKLLNQWAGRYNIGDNKSLKFFDYIQKMPDAKEKIIERIKRSKNTDYLITGHSAARLYNLSISNADRLHIYALTNDVRKIENDLGLIEVDYDSGITVIDPKHRNSIIKAQGIEEKKYIVDLIQLYLDCRALNDRGYEQAEEIMELLIKA